MIFRSPIPYMGNKLKLVPDLFSYFPKDIDTIYDLFGGSGVVGFNALINKKCKSMVYNELNGNIYELTKMFTDYSYQELLDKIEYYIDKYGLTRQSIDVRGSLDQPHIQQSKEAYSRLRDDYNKSENKDVVMLYTLSLYSFCHLLRFNTDNEFNMPVGNCCFNEDARIDMRNWMTEIGNLRRDGKGITLLNENAFDILEHTEFKKNDFVYNDPPYFQTDAVYNEKRAFGGWTEKDDYRLFDLLDKLDSQGVKFGMSNTYENKGMKNNHLKEWAEGRYKVIHINFKYYSLGKGNAENDEVYITNSDCKVLEAIDLWE